jgi:hypothetical protein
VVNISISPDQSGTNRWSTNVTDTFKGLVSGGYLLTASSGQVRSAQLTGRNVDEVCHGAEVTEPYSNDYFTLLPAANATPTMVPQTTIQSPPMVQPTTSLTVVSPTTQSSPLPGYPR